MTNNSKKIMIGLSSIFIAGSLAACGNRKDTVATTSIGNISQKDFYNRLKESPESTQTLQQLVVDKILDKKYGKKVSNKEVNKKINKYKKSYGSQFKSMIEQSGMTMPVLKQETKTDMLMKYAIKDEFPPTKKQLADEWDKYQPEVKIAQITTKNENTAKKVISELKSGKNFKNLAMKYSDNHEQTISKFDGYNNKIDIAIKRAAFNLNTDSYSTQPVKLSKGFVVLKVIQRADKGTLAEHKKALVNAIDRKTIKDPEKTIQVTNKLIKKNKVKIQDKSLKKGFKKLLSSSN